MSEYLPTKRGAELAKTTGLDDLAQRLYNNDDPNLYALNHIAAENSYGFNRVEPEDLDANIVAARALLKTPDETTAFDRALHLDVESSEWRYIGDLDDSGLFPVRPILSYAAAAEDDRLVLSGAVGLSLANFRNRYPLLARSRYQEYGFRTYNESTAFVGAYIVSKFIELDSLRITHSKAPSFQYVDKGVVHMIAVGGSFHGDFRMAKSQIAEDTSLSPIDTWTEFGRTKAVGVDGYHSVEPDIVTSLLEAEYLRAGVPGLKDLLHEFETHIANIQDTSDSNDQNKTPFMIPAFADYGSRDVSFSLGRLKLLMAKDNEYEFPSGKALHSTPYLPQSSTLFEIIPTASGVRFQNSNEKMDDEPIAIELDRQHYVDLFGILMDQTAGGYGRSSPYQLAEIIIMARQIVDAHS